MLEDKVKNDTYKNLEVRRQKLKVLHWMKGKKSNVIFVLMRQTPLLWQIKTAYYPKLDGTNQYLLYWPLWVEYVVGSCPRSENFLWSSSVFFLLQKLTFQITIHPKGVNWKVAPHRKSSTDFSLSFLLLDTLRSSSHSIFTTSEFLIGSQCLAAVKQILCAIVRGCKKQDYGEQVNWSEGSMI